MKTDNILRAIQGYMVAASDSIKNLIGKMGNTDHPVHYDFQKKTVVDPQTMKPAYIFGFTVVSESKELRDQWADTVELATASEGAKDAFFEVGGKIRAINLDKQK